MMMMKRTHDIKAIIFDFGEVINSAVDYEAEMARRTLVAEQLKLPPEDLWTYLFEGQTARELFTGKLTRDQFWVKVLAPRGVIDPEEIKVIYETLWDSHGLNPEIADLLLDLHGHYKLAVLSNTQWSEQQMQEMLYIEFGLPHGLFDIVITSSSAGVVKPHPAIFRHALERLGVRPEEAIYTDDLVSFTNAAAKLGIHAHTFTNVANFREYLQELGVLDGARSTRDRRN